MTDFIFGLLCGMLLMVALSFVPFFWQVWAAVKAEQAQSDAELGREVRLGKLQHPYSTGINRE